MAEILIKNLGKSITVANPTKPLLWLILNGQIDWMHSCGGKGRCTTCKASVLVGLENMAPLTAAETKYRAQGQLKPDERLACQAKTHGDVVLQVPEECKLPHMIYND